MRKQKVRLPIMIQDPLTSHNAALAMSENVIIERESFFLDGPVSSQVAILDFDPQSGVLLPGTRYLPPKPGNKVGTYDVEPPSDPALDIPPAFMRISLFGIIYKTINLFEEPDVLGRTITWAFDGPQLLVIPRAGIMKNAYYERESHSLQFFFFPSEATRSGNDKNFYTCLSRDIVAHETAHAIIDGIVPDLYGAAAPQALAMHESLADLTALLMAFTSKTLSVKILDTTHGSIEDSSAFSSIAEEFGKATESDRPEQALRSLLNDLTLDLVDNEPHDLSEVLSGALYTIMVNLHREYWRRRMAEEHVSKLQAAHIALGRAADQFKRMIYRALDYLPPGEASFADYGRALLAADQAEYPDEAEVRGWVVDEFVRRKMVPNAESLQVTTNFAHAALADLDLDKLLTSDWLAYDFANRHRDLLQIPADVPFTIAPRLKVEKQSFHGEHLPAHVVHECIFKVKWEQSEENPLGGGLPSKRVILVGTTLVIEWENKQIRSLLTTGQVTRPDEAALQSTARTHFLQSLLLAGQFSLTEGADSSNRLLLGPSISVHCHDNMMRIQGSARLLHLARGGSNG